MADAPRSRAAAIGLIHARCKERRLALATGVVLWAVLSCAMTPLERRPWLLQRTPHFELHSALGDAATARLAHELEAFVTACEAVYGTRLALSTRIRVYAHDGKGLERPFERGNEPAWFLSATGAAVLVLRGGGGFSDAKPETRAEIARYLAHANGALDTPLWLDEGLAAFLGAARVGGRQAILGDPRFDLLAVLEDQIWPAADTVLAVRSLDDQSRRLRAIFRARAWLMVHYALLGELPADHPRPVLALARARAADIPPTALAWFGIPADTFDAGMRRHAADPGRGRLAIRAPQPLAQSTPAASLDCAGVGKALGWLALELSRDGLARDYYRFAGRCDPSSATAHAGMAVVESLAGRFDTAAELARIAETAAPEDPQVAILLGRSLEARVRDSDGKQTREESLAAARAQYLRAARLAPQDPAAFERLGRSVVADPTASKDARVGAVAALDTAQALRPAALNVMLDRARAHADLGERSHAGALARIVATRADDEALREAALALSAWSERPEGARP